MLELSRRTLLIEEREESDDEETGEEDPAKERFEEAADFQIVWGLRQEGHIGSGHYRAYQGYDEVANSNSSKSFSSGVSHSLLEHLYSQL